MAGQKKLLCLMVTDEQDEVLEGIYNSHGWDFERVEPETAREYLNMESQATSASEECTHAGVESHIQGANECPHCLCAPCVASEEHRQMWWPMQNTGPSAINRPIRKELYKKFWALLYNMKVWEDPRYLDSKARALAQDPKQRCYRWHRREIMPDCILKRVCDWHPKTANEEYVGHRWENQ